MSRDPKSLLNEQFPGPRYSVDYFRDEPEDGGLRSWVRVFDERSEPRAVVLEASGVGGPKKKDAQQRAAEAALQLRSESSSDAAATDAETRQNLALVGKHALHLYLAMLGRGASLAPGDVDGIRQSVLSDLALGSGAGPAGARQVEAAVGMRAEPPSVALLALLRTCVGEELAELLEAAVRERARRGPGGNAREQRRGMQSDRE